MKATPASNAFIDSSARLLSPAYPAATICTQFWYKTNGNSHLNIKSLTFGALSSSNYFNFKGSNGNEWAFGQATIIQSNSFQIVFETVVKNASPNGYVKIDDIEIKFKTCSLPASCNFEDDFCGYSSVKDADFEWIILDGEFGINQNIWLVPQFDNTFNSQFGHFLYLDSIRAVGSKAKIHSETLVASSSVQCLQFYIYMRKNGGTLNVYKENKLNMQSELLYTENANLDNLWYEREYELKVDDTVLTPDQDLPYTFVFEGITQSSEGALAIDDIKLYNGKCLGTQVLPGIFDCQNGGQVVNDTVLCDFKEDCSNGRDEKVCGTCNFEDEYGACGWTDKSVGSYFWQRSNKGSIATNKPNNDHTYGNNTG